MREQYTQCSGFVMNCGVYVRIVASFAVGGEGGGVEAVRQGFEVTLQDQYRV
jgi:hypothetical protein